MSKKIVFKNQEYGISIIHPVEEVNIEKLIEISVPVKVKKKATVNFGVSEPYETKEGDYIDARLAVANNISFTKIPHTIVDESDIPEEKIFRDAWILEGDKVVENLEISKEISHDIRRNKRDLELSPWDKQVNYAAGDIDKISEIEIERNVIRNKYSQIQSEIDQSSSVEELKNILKSF